MQCYTIKIDNMHIEFLNSTTDGNKRDSINSNVSSISSSPFTFVSGADSYRDQNKNSPLQTVGFSLGNSINSTVKFDSRYDSVTYTAEKKALPTCRR